MINVDGKPSIIRMLVPPFAKPEIMIPEWLNILREVTDEEAYSTYVMAGLDYKLPEADK